jgi:ATP-dependent Clp protease, protease subunit
MKNFNETSVEDTISMLRESRAQYQVQYEVKIDNSALVAAAILANRYITDRSLPHSAIDLVQRAATKLQRENSAKLIQVGSIDRQVLELAISRLKEQVTAINIEIRQAERNYNLSLAAELSYGKLPEICRQLEAVQVEFDRFDIPALSSDDLELSDRDIAEIVAEVTGFSLDRVLALATVAQSAKVREADDLTPLSLQDRIIFLDSEIDRDLANAIVTQLLFLELEDADRDIFMYINSPGGSVSAGMSIFDIMNKIRPDVCTICMGFAGGMGAFLLSAGAKGKRMSLSAGRIMINKPSSGLVGQAIDLEIQQREIRYLTAELNHFLAEHTGQNPAKIDRDTNRDFYLSAAEAKEYSLIDLIIDRPMK